MNRFAAAAACACIVAAATAPASGREATATDASGATVASGQTLRATRTTVVKIREADDAGSRDVVFAPNPEGFGETNAGIGTFQGEDGAWQVSAGFALIRGWRPTAKGPRTTIGAEGSTIILQIERIPPGSGTPGRATIVERGFLVEGKKATIVIHDNGVARAAEIVPAAEASEQPWVWSFSYAEGDQSRGRFEPPRRLDPGTDQRLAAFVRAASAER